MSRYLVTGGLGFIGNELVRRLSPLGEVVILDNRHRCASNIDDLAATSVLEVNLTDRTATQRAIIDVRPETVFHLAAIHFSLSATPHLTEH